MIEVHLYLASVIVSWALTFFYNRKLIDFGEPELWGELIISLVPILNLGFIILMLFFIYCEEVWEKK